MGKSSFAILTARIVKAYNYCMNDNGWQELFNIDSLHPYKLLIVDGIQSTTDFPLTLIEHISTAKIAMKRGGKDPG